jgi:hypothetical protein
MFIPPVFPQSPSPIIRGWYNRPVVAAEPKVPPHKLRKKVTRHGIANASTAGNVIYLMALKIINSVNYG